MKALLRKDFYFLSESKAQIGIIIFILALSIFIAIKNPDFAMGFVTSYLLVICAMRPSQTISYDEENNGLAYLMTLAISRKTYVDSKYVLTFIVSLGTGILLAIQNTAIELISGSGLFLPKDHSQITFIDIAQMIIFIQIIVTCVSLILNSIYLPSYIKYGVKKGAIVSIIGTMGFFFITVGLLTIVSSNRGIESLVYNMLSDSLINILLIVIGVSAACIMISYSISQKIIRAKEF